MNKEEMLKKWSEFYMEYAEHEVFQTCDFADLTMGFFMALGAQPEDLLDLYNKCASMGKI